MMCSCPDRREASRIAKALLTAHLAACVNIISGVESHFWWKGKIEKAPEVLLIIKTKASLVSKVMDKIAELHSYECPVIEVIAMEKMNLEAVKWMEEALN